MTTNASWSTRNYLLNKLTPDVRERLLPNLEPVDAYLGLVLHKPYEKIEYVYFPNNSMASIVAHAETGQSTEVGVIGCEGAAGLEVLMGHTSSPNEALIQIPDSAHRIRSRFLLAEFEESLSTRRLFLAFINRFIIQISQTTLCNRLHTVEQRLARWLSMCHDRVDRDYLQLTHEFLGFMLGVERKTVTMAASSFQDLGLISYVRGKLVVADYEGLQAASCPCYAIVKAEYDENAIQTNHK